MEPSQNDHPLLELGAQLHLAIGGVQAAVDQMHATLNHNRSEYQAQRIPLHGSATVPAAGGATTLIIDLGSPTQGYQWTLRSVFVSDPGGMTKATAGFTAVGVARGITVPNATNDATQILSGIAVAGSFASALFGDGQIKIMPNDHLLLYLFSPATGSQSFHALAEVDVYKPETLRKVQDL